MPFAEVRKVWRNTTQSMCGQSGFFEQFFPLVRAINQKLPTTKRLRVLAGDPPIDWEKVKTSEEASKFLDRGPSIVSVMEKEVLSKHRKALMLFGTFHLMHGTETVMCQPTRKTIRTSRLSSAILAFTTRTGASDRSARSHCGPYPSLAITKGTWLGALSLSDIFPPPFESTSTANLQCANRLFPPRLQNSSKTNGNPHRCLPLPWPAGVQAERANASGHCAGCRLHDGTAAARGSDVGRTLAVARRTSTTRLCARPKIQY